MLLNEAENMQAAYLVMGAYGHSRAREFLFGGVTRSLFKNSPVPLVVSH
ncbi:universal stress protein [Parasphingorhabdus sp.]